MADLTSWQNVRYLFGSDVPDFEDAAVVFDYLIKAASDSIRRETGRRFTIGRVTQTRVFTAAAGGNVYMDEMLDPADVASVTGPAGLVQSSEYQLIPDEFPSAGTRLRLTEQTWPYELARLVPDHLDWFTRNMNPPEGLPYNWEHQQVSVNGTWGYTETPKEIDYLTARTVQLWWTTGIAQYTADANEVTVPETLPTEVTRKLKKWKKPKVRSGVIGG